MSEVARARDILAAWVPPSASQAQIRDEIVEFCDDHRDALDRRCRPGHLTASALVVDDSGERVLLHLHRKLRKWLQLGGHCDGDGDLAGVALREAIEESGISTGLVVEPEPLDVDIHEVAPPAEDVHLHLDTCFVVHAPPGAQPSISDESLDLAWFTLEAATQRVDEARLIRLFAQR